MKKLLCLIICVATTACGGSTGGSNVPIPISDPVIEINVTQSQPLALSIGQQLDDFSAFDAVRGQSRLNSLHPDWFRIHAGDDSDTLPEVSSINDRNAWDFTALNRLVEIAYLAQAKPILNIRHAPVSLSTCNLFHGAKGALKDPSFSEFADYMANLVAYYNRGGFTDASGTHSNPHGTTHRIDYWELWNEPELPYEFPCLKESASQASLNVAQYTSMWNIVTERMSAVDPTIKFVGPSISDPRILDYMNAVIGQKHPPDLISVHGYAGSNTSQDIELLNGGGSAIGIVGIENAISLILASLDRNGRSDTPLLLDEYNVSPDGNDDPYERGWNQLSSALGGSLFIRLAKLSSTHPVGFIPFQFVEAGGKRLSSLDSSTGQPKLPFWRDMLLRAAVKAGDTSLHAQVSSTKVDVLATRSADGSRISVLVANAQVVKTGLGTRGESLKLTLKTENMTNQKPKSITIRVIDTDTDSALGPPIQTLDPSQNPTISFNGYGLALVELLY